MARKTRNIEDTGTFGYFLLCCLTLWISSCSRTSYMSMDIEDDPRLYQAVEEHVKTKLSDEFLTSRGMNDGFVRLTLYDEMFLSMNGSYLTYSVCNVSNECWLFRVHVHRTEDELVVTGSKQKKVVDYYGSGDWEQEPPDPYKGMGY